MKDLSPEEAGRWLEAAPTANQDAVTSPATGQAIEQIGKQHSLHIDVVGTLSKLISYMLIGYINPQEFLQQLVASGIKDADAQQIVKEVNEKIFIPLRGKIRAQDGAAVAAVQDKPMAPKVPMPAASLPKILNKLVPVPENLPGAMPQKIAAPTTPSRPILATPAPIVPPKPPSNIEKLLNDHEEAHIEFKKAATAPLPVLPPAPVAPFAPPPVPKAPAASIKPPATPIAKNYAVDPYREQVEEHEK